MSAENCKEICGLRRFRFAASSLLLGTCISSIQVTFFMLENVLARTKGFVLLRGQKRATSVRWKSVARFLVLRPAKLVAWGGIEPPTQGFSKHVLVKSSLFTTG
jgi:hypothetical protein